jgi:hypothetical protein
VGRHLTSAPSQHALFMGAEPGPLGHGCTPFLHSDVLRSVDLRSSIFFRSSSLYFFRLSLCRSPAAPLFTSVHSQQAHGQFCPKSWYSYRQLSWFPIWH